MHGLSLGLPAAAVSTLLHNLSPHWVHQPLPCRKASSPGCPSLPLLLVWMNVSSLSPWLWDFHTVRFSVSSGCILFLNCCHPSFGCAGTHSVPTYTSILAGSPVLSNLLWLAFFFKHSTLEIYLSCFYQVCSFLLLNSISLCESV